CIFHSFIHSFFIIDITFTKAHVDDFGPIIYGIAYTVGYILIAFITIRNDAYPHNFYIVGNTVNTDAVLTFCADDTCHMRTVISIGTFNISISIMTFCRIFIVVANDMAGIVIFVQMIFGLVTE